MSHCLSGILLPLCGSLPESGKHLKFGRLEGGKAAVQAVPSLPHHLSCALQNPSAPPPGEDSLCVCLRLVVSESILPALHVLSVNCSNLRV